MIKAVGSAKVLQTALVAPYQEGGGTWNHPTPPEPHGTASKVDVACRALVWLISLGRLAWSGRRWRRCLGRACAIAHVPPAPAHAPFPPGPRHDRPLTISGRAWWWRLYWAAMPCEALFFTLPH